jgi:hypothetical protein
VEFFERSMTSLNKNQGQGERSVGSDSLRNHCPASPTAPTDDTMHGKWHRRIWLPGALMEMIPVRMQEVG